MASIQVTPSVSSVLVTDSAGASATARRKSNPPPMETGYLKAHVATAKAAPPPDKYTVYVIELKGTNGVLSSSRQSSWTVSRRFRQFFSLHEQLRAKKSFKNLLPEGPQKKVIGAKTPEFIEERRKLLQSYIVQLMKIPVLMEDENFCAFFDVQRFPYFEVSDKSGYLWKQGLWNPAFKKRWCITKDGFIYYFRGDKEPRQLAGAIPLEGCTITPSDKRDFAFGIFHPRGRNFFLAASDELGFKDWNAVLQSPEAKVGLTDFTMLTVLGKGSFGKVLRVRRNGTGELFAMKVLRKDAVRAQHQVEHTRTERQLLQRVKHPFLVELKFAFQTDDKLYMVLDYVQGGELFTHLKKEKKFNEERARFYGGEVCVAIEYLHSMGFIYRDLKPENLLIDIDGHIKLTDFGLSKNVSAAQASDRAAYTFCGTPEYMAPEVLTEQGHGKAVDWWSFGILLYEMLVGLPPFYSKNKKEMYFKILKSDPRYPSFISDEAKDLLSQLLKRNPSERMGAGPDDAAPIKGHLFFVPIDWQKLIAKEITPPFIPIIREDGDTSNFDPAFTKENPESPTAPSSTLKDADEFDGFTFMPQNPIKNAADEADAEAEALAEGEEEDGEGHVRERGVDPKMVAEAMAQVSLDD